MLTDNIVPMSATKYNIPSKDRDEIEGRKLVKETS